MPAAWKENITLFLLFAQVVATLGGLVILNWKIARKVTQWEATQKHTVERLEETKEQQKGVVAALEKIRTEVVDLGKRVYELFGQLKK